jgi:hypothetical protein
MRGLSMNWRLWQRWFLRWRRFGSCSFSWGITMWNRVLPQLTFGAYPRPAIPVAAGPNPMGETND